MIKVSVIIPIYNVEKYLDKCLESVSGQSLKSIEIICVNDGSTDSSGDILNKWAKKDSRIVVINQQNMGLSAARNAGLSIAQGEYVSFLDSDDWVSGDFFETLYSAVKNNDADTAMGGVVYYETMLNMYYGFVHEHCFCSNKPILTTPLDKYGPMQSCSACAKLYRRKMLTDNDLSFYHGKLLEDFPFTFTAIALSNQVISCPFTTMYYRQQPASIMANASKSSQAAFNLLENYKRVYAEFLEKDLPNKESYIQILQNFAMRNMMPWSHRLPTRRDQKQFLKNAYSFIRGFYKPDPKYVDPFGCVINVIANSWVLRNLFSVKYGMHKIEFWLFHIIPVFKFKEQEGKIKWLLLCYFNINLKDILPWRRK